MKMDRKVKANSNSDATKLVKKTRDTGVKSHPKTNGKHLPWPYEHAPIGIVESSLDGKYLNVNHEFRRILGYEKEELLKGDIKVFTYGEDQPSDMVLYEQLCRGEIPFYKLEKRYIRKDGNIVWVELTRSVVRDAKGKILYVVSTVLDISERKKSEAQVKWQAHLLAQLADAVISTDANFVLTSWNMAAEQIYGWNAEEVIGKTAQEVLQTEFIVSTRETAREQVRQIGDFSGEVMQQRKDGTKIIIEGKVIAVRDNDGNIEGYVSVNRDVTERKRAEDALRESQQRFSATYEYAPIGIVECSLDGKYLNVNEEFCRILRYQKEELVGHGFKGITHEDDYAIDMRLYQKLVAGEIPFYKLEKRYVRKTGEPVWVEITRSPVRNAAGAILYTIGVILDISERKQVESALRESAERLRLATQSARMFTWEWDFQKRIYTLADNFERVVGFSAGLLPKGTLEPLLKLSPSEDVEAIATGVRQAIADHTNLHSLQYRMMDPASDQKVWLEVSANIVFDEEQKPVRMFGVAQNITEKKRVEQEIMVASSMPAQNPNPVMRLTPDGKVLYANSSSRHFLNSSKHRARDIIPHQLQRQVQETFASNSKRQIEIKQNGRIFSFTLVPVLEAGYVNLYGSDVSERKQAEEEIQRLNIELQQRLDETNTLLEILPTGVWIGNEDVSVITGNSAAYQMLGLEEGINASITNPEPQTPTGLQVFINGEIASPEDAPMQQVARTGEPIYNMEHELLFADGTRKSVYVNIVPLLDQNGAVRKVIGAYTDFTEQKQAEQALKEYARQQEALYLLTDRLQRTGSLEDVFNAALDAILNALQCDRASILLYDNAKVMRFVAWRGLSDEYRKATDGHSPWTPDTKNPEPICMDDVETADLSDSLRATVKKEEIGSLAFIPLVIHGKLIGKFMAYFDTPHVFSEEEVDLSLTIAHQLAFGVDRKRAEEQLRLSEDRLRLAVTAGNIGIWDIDLQRRDRIWSKEGKAIYGLREDEFLDYERQLALIHPDDRARVDEQVRAFRDLGTLKQLNVEHRIIHPDGSLHWVEVQGEAIYNGDSLPIRLIGTIVDITERKRAEQALRESERKFSLIYDKLPFAATLSDPQNGILLDVNEAFEKIFGYTKQEVIGKTSLELGINPNAEARARTLAQLRAENSVHGIELELLTRWNGMRLFLVNIDLVEINGQKHILQTAQDITEQKHTEDALRASEALYRTIARSIPGGGVYVVDRDFRYVVAEGSVTEDFGLTREVLEGRTVTEAFPDERGARMEERLKRTFAGETISFETKQDGRVFWTQQAPLLNSLGQAIIVTIDITERKQMEEALRQSEERFRALLSQATAGIVRKDHDGRFTYVNQAFCNMLGYTDSELLGKTVWEFMYPEDVAENKGSFERLMMEGVPFKLERRFLRENGSIIWVDASVSPIMDETGKPQSAVAVEVDITGRKQAEEALQQLNLQLENRVQQRTIKLNNAIETLRDEIAERRKVELALRRSEATSRLLFNTAPDTIIITDESGNIVHVNARISNLFGYDPDEILGKPVEFLMPERFHERHREHRRTYSEQRLKRAMGLGMELYGQRQNGSEFPIDVMLTPIANIPGWDIMVTIRDITERKEMEDALYKSHERLRVLSQRLVEVQEEERRAIARELHDRVGQTLAALNINMIIINSQLTPDVAQQIGTRLSDSMKLVAETIALVRDVMTDLRPAVLDDYGLEAALEAHVAQFIARYDINVKFEKPNQPIPRLGPSVEMTFMRIAQEALMNIARHAHATQVDLSIWQEEDAIMLTIHDNGIGIESWQNANRPGSHGLTIMRERAEAVGGTLKVKSVPGEGTTIEARIPFKNQSQVEGQEKPA